MRSSEGLEAWFALATAPVSACPKPASGLKAAAAAAPASTLRLPIPLFMFFPPVVCFRCGIYPCCSERAFAQQFFDTLLRHRQLADVLAHPRREIGLDLIGPACIDLARGITPLAEPLVPEHVAQTHDLRGFHHQRRKLGRYEDHAAIAAEHDIAGHHRRRAD